jgi:stage II sporulation protein M
LRSYLSKLLPYAALSASLFAVGILAGMIAIVWLPEAAAGVERSIAEFVQYGHGLGPAGLFAFIVINNVVKAAVMMFAGMVFGLIPIFFLVFNGMVLSVVATLIANKASALVAVAGLAPHGIIEISAVLLAAAAGLRLGVVAVERLRRRDVKLKMELGRAWRFFVSLVLPALLVAAVIETLVTPFLLMMAMG